MGKIKITNGKEQLEIDSVDLKDAINDGYRQVQTIPVTNGKEVLYIDDTDLENAMKDGYVKKKPDSKPLPTPLDNGSKDGGSGLQLTPKDEIPLVDITGNGKTEVVGDPFELVKVAGDLDKKTEPIGFGMGVKEAPDMKAKKEAEGLYGQIKKEYGINDPQNLYEETKDLTVHDYAKEGFSKEQLLQDRQENNPVYHRKIARLKWEGQLESKLAENLIDNKFSDNPDENKNEYDRTLGIIDNSLNGIDASDDYEQKRGNIQTIAKIIEQHGGDKKDELLKNLATETSIVYGKAAGENDAAFKANPLSKYLNPNQLAAYNFIQDTAPDKVDGYAAVFVDPNNIKDNSDAQIGREEKLRRLEEIGLDLKTSYANENLNALGNQAKHLGIDEVQNTEPSNDPFSQIINTAKEESKGLNAKYPKSATIDADEFAQEILGQKNTGLNWLALETGKATENTAKGIWDLVSEPFRSEEGSNIHQLETVGDTKVGELVTHLNQENQTTKTFTPTLSDQLKTDITAIKDNKDLTDKEKYSKVVDLLKNRPNEWQRTPIEGGKTNIGLTSLMYGIGGLAANLAPFMAMEALTGGGATAGAVRKFTSAFTSAAATGFHDAYAEALKEGVSNPYAQAMRVTAINSAAMAGAGTPDAIRKMLGSTKGAIGDLVGKMSDDEIMGALRHSPEALSTFQKAFNIGKKATTSLATGFKEGAKVSAFTTSGQAANDLINGDIKTLPDYLKQAAIETLKFGIFGGITGMVSKAGEKVTDINKAALFSAGKDPKAFLEALDQKVQAGTISPKDAEQVKQNVEKAAKVFDSVPMVNGKGKPLSEIEQRDLMFLKMQEADISETLKKDIPESLANKLGEKVVAIQDQMDKIYKGTYLEKAPLPKKEETPKPEEPKLTQPIEGQGGIVFKIGNLVTTKDGKQGEVAEIKDGKARIVIKGFDESGALPTRDLGWHDLNDLKAQKEGLDENSVPLPNKEIKSNWNYEGEGDAFSSNKDSRDGKSAYVIRVLDTNGRGSSYNRAKQRGELDIESPLTYDGDKESVSAIDGNGNTVGVIKLQTDGGIEHIVVAPEFARKGVATELVKQIESKGGKVIPEKSKQISPDASKFFNKLSETKKAQPIELSVEPKEQSPTVSSEEVKGSGVGGDVEATAKALENVDLGKMPNVTFHGSKNKDLIFGKPKEGGDRKSNMQLDFGTHFTSEDYASFYTGDKGKKYPAIIDLKNPLDLTQGNWWKDDPNFEAVNKLIKDLKLEKEYGSYDYYDKNGDKQQEVQSVSVNAHKLNNKIPKKVSDALKANGFDGIIYEPYHPQGGKYYEAKPKSFIVLDNSAIKEVNPKNVAEAYHKAKKDGSNPELVKAVEQSIKEPQTNVNAKAKEAEKPTTEGLTEITGGNEPKPEQKGSNPKENVGEAIQPQQTALEKAKEARREAKAKLDAIRKNMGVIPNDKQKAQALVDYHRALVTEAKEHIKEGIKTAQDFAKAIGEKLSVAVKTAWDEATGAIKPIKDADELKYDLDNLDLEAGGISKKSLKAEYGFVQDFPSRSDKEVATTAMDNLQEAADNNGVSIEQQAANEVALMKNKKGEASEHDIMVAAYHLRNLDEQIAKANKNNIDAEHLLNQREEALTALRQLGNNAGRNLRLFGNVYKKVEGGRLEVVRAELKRDLGVDDIPKTMIDLKLSKLSDADKKKVEPYVKAIEELNKTINDINTKATKATADIHSQEVQDYIDNEVAKRLKDQKPTTPKAREKKSQLFKDIAQRIRTENELEKFAKSAGGKEIHKNSIFGDVDFKELAAQAMDYLAKGVEKGEDLAELIKKASIKFKGKFDASEFGKALNTIVSKASLPDKDEVIGKIKDIAQNENANGITPDMVRHGLINDVVNHYIHSDTPTNSVIKEATKELKQHLPDVTEEQVQDAILRRGEFKPKTKQQLKNEISDKAAEVKKLATTQSDSRELGNGIRKETSNKSEIKIAKAAEDFINEIKNDDTLTDEVKKQHIKAVEEQRDADLANTRQGVLVNLKDAIDNHVSELTTKQNDAIVAGDKKTAEDLSEVKNDLQNLSKALSPNPEKLKDQIDKADQDLQAIIKSNEGTQIAKDLTDIQKEFHDNWQKTFDELEQQRLLNSAKQGQKEAERRLLAGQYTEIPTTPYEAKTNNILAQQEAATKRAWNKLNSLSIKAKEQKDKKGIVNKWLNTRRDIMIMSFGAIEKVAGSAVTKPFLDPLIKQTFGRLSGLITGVKPTALSRLGSTYRQLKNEASANEFMKKANNNYIDALVNHEKVVKEFGKDSEQAKKSFDKVQQAEINHLAALPYLFINAGSHVDIAQVITKGATDFDANIGKYQQSLAKERTKWEGTKFWLQSVNRTHAAMKSISHRQALIDHYIENLQHIQSKEGSVSNEARQHAWDVATLAAEEGRFGEKTKLSELIAGAKNSRSNWVKYPAKFLAPVAKISINITKQGIDMAFPFVESTAKTLGSNALKGVKLNKADGIEFKNFASKYYNGIKRGFDELPLQQKKYINTLISRGLFGVAQYALVGYALANGGMKFGGSYDSNDPYHKKKVLGSDGQPLDYDEWEMGGVRLPKLLNIVINHSPYSLPASLAAVTHDQLKSEDKKGMQIFHAFTKTANEVYHRLPFSTMVDVGKAAFGDEYKLENIVANEVPTMKSTAEYFDKTKEGEPREVDKGGTGFWNTTGKIIESKIPLVRNTLPTKTYGVKNYNEGGREITSEENANYESKKIEETNKQIDLLKRGERPENTFVKDGEEVTKKLDDMTPDEQTSAKTAVKKEVTEALKKQLFGDKPEKTPQEKQDENLQRSLRRQFYINKGEPIPDYLKDPESTPQ